MSVFRKHQLVNFQDGRKREEGKIPQIQLQAIKQLGLWLPAATLGNPFESHIHVHMDALSSAYTWKERKKKVKQQTKQYSGCDHSFRLKLVNTLMAFLP